MQLHVLHMFLYLQTLEVGFILKVQAFPISMKILNFFLSYRKATSILFWL